MNKELTKLSSENPFCDAPVYYIGETVSTMILAKEILGDERNTSAVVPGSVIAAGFQTGGKGRFPGRKWEAAAGKNLTFTLIIDKDYPGVKEFPLSLSAGLGLAMYLEKEHHLSPKIKWPNDILLNSRKLSGILVESAGGFYLLGIGLNVNQIEFNGELAERATSLGLETGLEFNPQNELPLLLGGIHQVLGSKDKRKSIEDRLYSRGSEVLFVPGDPGKEKPFKGVIRGIDNGGFLLLEKSDGSLFTAASGEIVY